MTIRWTRSTDVVVVGLGMTGGALIDGILDGSSRDVLVLDRGASWDPETDLFPDEEDTVRGRGLTVPVEADHVQLRTTSGCHTIPKWWAPRRAGGGSLLWYGHLSRFQPSDLRLGQRGSVGAPEVRDWPLEYHDLESAYDRVQQRLEAYGCEYGYSAEEYQRLEGAAYRRRPAPSVFEAHAVDRLRSADVGAYIGHTCLGGRAWDLNPIDPMDGRPGAKRRPLLSRPNWYVPVRERMLSHPRATLLADSHVTRVLVAQGRAVGVEYLQVRDGEVLVRRVRCRSVVLACGALETSRILLSSDLPNRNGLLGRRFTFTLERVAYIVTDVPRSPDPSERAMGMFGNVVVKDYYDGSPDAAEPAKLGKFSIYDGYAAEAPTRHVRNLNLRGHDLARFLEVERRSYVAKLSFKGESVASHEKYVSLSSSRNALGVPVPRVTYVPHPLDLRAQGHVAGLVRRLGRALGATRTVLRPAPHGPGLVSAHQHGGAVFGEDPTDAVVSPEGECYEARGLFVADGAVMPTSGGTNSSLTAMANAVRVADVVAAGG